MVVRGSKKYGISLVYRVPHEGELRFMNCSERKAKETIENFGKPDDIAISRKNRKSTANDTLTQAKRLANELRAEFGFSRKYGGRESMHITKFSRQIKIIRKALKSLCPTLSVRRALGTTYGWIDISPAKRGEEFTEEEKHALKEFGLPYSRNYAVISPEDRDYWVGRAEEILS